MILGTDSKTAGRRVARYIAGLVLVVLERDGALPTRALENAVADAFDAHGLRLARAAKRPTATAAAARWVPTVCRALADAGFIDTSALGTHWVLEARRVKTTAVPDVLGVGRSTVQRWIKRGMLDGRPTYAAIWRAGDESFPARAPLPVQAELALDVARKNPVKFAAISPTDDDVRRAEAAAVNMVEPVEAPPPAPAKPERAWSVTTFEIARFEVDGVHVVAERGSKRTSVGYEPDEDGFCMDNADPAAVLRYARMLEAAALWALGGES